MHAPVSSERAETLAAVDSHPPRQLLHPEDGKRQQQPGTDQVHDPALSDAVLLEQFVRLQDADAFTRIVRRYERLVMGVALRQVGDRERAEDVFQATFLVLAERAAKIRNPSALASWLHGTARRIGLDALRQQRRESLMSELNDAPSKADPVLQQLQRDFERQALDEELAKLPEKLRLPLVLHYLEGLTGREVAERLNLSVDAVEGRLKQGRNRLRERLVRHGVGFAAVAAAFQMAQQATASTILAERTAAAAVAWIHHKPLDGCTANAARLAGKELTAMTAVKTTTLLTGAAALLLGSGFLGAWALAGAGEGSGGTGRPLAAAIAVRAGEPSDGDVTGEFVADEAATANEADPASATTASLKVNDGLHQYQQPSAARKRIEQALEQPVAASLEGATLTDALDQLGAEFGIPVRLDRVALSELGVEPDDLVIEFAPLGLHARELLETVLRTAADDELDYYISNGVLYITTRDRAETEMETVVYELRDLGENFPSGHVAELLESGTTGYWMHVDGEGGQALPIPGGVMVRQTQRVHREIQSILDQLRQFAMREDLPQVTRDEDALLRPGTAAYPPGTGGGGFGGGMGGGGGGLDGGGGGGQTGFF